MTMPRVWLGLILLAGGSVTLAQATPQLRETSYTPHQLTPQEGMKIVNAALEQEQQVGRKLDCSHLTHEVYAVAGYPYPYASSFDLYAGIGSFVRVTKPQPGDLVVWPGHVGIVVDPIEHSFYSSVRSGLRTEFYDAPHWKARGPARFYRYGMVIPANFVLTGSRLAKTRRDSPAITASVVDDTHENSPDSPHSTTKSSDFPSSAVTGRESTSMRTTLELPASILITASQGKPTQAEIAGAISELNSATGDILREQDLSRLRQSVIIYDDFTLDRAEIKGKHGSAQVRIECRATLVEDRIEQIRRHEKLRWDLVHTGDGWQVLAPKNTFYVPRDVAIRMLAARLASLAQEANASAGDSLREQAQIVRVLSALLEGM